MSDNFLLRYSSYFFNHHPAREFDAALKKFFLTVMTTFGQNWERGGTAGTSDDRLIAAAAGAPEIRY